MEAKSALREQVRAAMRRCAKSRPETLFEQAFFDLREKAKGLKKKWEQEAAEHLEARLVQDLKKRGVPVVEHKLSVGRYRGSGFVTSFKLKVKVGSKEEAEKIAEYLRGKYSPKWKVKEISDEGVAKLNVR